MVKLKNLSVLLVSLLFIACNESDSSSTTGATTGEKTDITDAIFTRRATSCATYIDSYSSSVSDTKDNSTYEGSLIIENMNGTCTFTTTYIPNHDFDTTNFATPVSAQIATTYTIVETPTAGSSNTPLSFGDDNAIMLNGVALDILSAACFGVTEAGVSDGVTANSNIGCSDVDEPFRYDPMSPLNNFGTDTHNAHTQPNGLYHYHGSPVAMFDSNASVESPVIGFASDGYPIYGPYGDFDGNGTIRAAVSGYQLKSGTRAAVTYNSVTYAPGGSYDGTYTSDWEHNATLGDLDECNGMTDINGNYGYYVTSTYPWVLNCYHGTPDASFEAGPPN